MYDAYDVLYLDQASHQSVIAAGLGRESAVTLARARRAGGASVACSWRGPSPRRGASSS